MQDYSPSNTCWNLQVRWIRKFLRVILAVVAVFLIYMLYTRQVVTVHVYQSIFSENVTLPNESSEGCVFPRPDPFDISILPYFFKEKPLNCQTVQPPVTSLSEEGILLLNSTAFKILLNTSPNVSCSYYDTWLADDRHLKYGNETPLLASQNISTDTCLVQCVDNGTVVYDNVHIYPKNPSSMPSLRNRYSKPSVMILTLDSTSRLNFMRQLPKSYEYLTQILGATVFKGHTKIGDNTYPNIIPLLTGLRISVNPEENEFPWSVHDIHSMNVDEMPLLWYTFRKAGYLTLYAEDFPNFGLFTGISKGFLKPPLDYYMRTFWVACDRTTLHKQSRSYCKGDSPRHSFLFRYTKQFIKKHVDFPYFSFTFVSEISHDYINMVQLVDDELFDFLKSSVEEKLLEDTIIIVMGDHGNRYDKIRRTVIGRIEERMPFFSIRLPPWLSQKHPHLVRNLEANSERLTSWFDVYEMLVDVNLNDFQEGPPRVLGMRNRSRHGISLFRQVIPANRTCRDAGIPEEYCVCLKETPLPTQGKDIQAASWALVHHVNEILLPNVHSCHLLELKKVISASGVLPAWTSKEGSSHNSNNAVHIRVVVETSPNDALLEALLRRTNASDSFQVHGDVSRVNKYGNQSACIHEATVRPFCLCRKAIIP